ncbi:uncharacterized protein si:dkey-75a21.2 isoform X1 [Hippocampus zosterae]|uniref:uncharacterized protein si:dkey-75a21.2 isoform X1 n=1 Tax=Hippocampus zosterae TaxID=109293 RepID=UPI00223E47D4|nr:uncharacterized protein si:dkey-75a21.2 isoform X1 [Hippocampus zosterae]
MQLPANTLPVSPARKPGVNRLNGITFKGSCEKKRFTCTSLSKNISEFPALKDYLPVNYDYHVCDFNLIRETDDHVDFKATFRMVLSSKEEIQLWLKSHRVGWRVDRTYATKGQKVIFKVDYRCQHKTRPRGPVKVPGQSKNTDCPAKMSVTLLRTQVSRGRQSLSADSHLPVFPTMVSLCNEHNHNIDVPESLLEAPRPASDVAQFDFEEDRGGGYVIAATANGAFCPTLDHCYIWSEEPEMEVVLVDVQEDASEEALHQAAALQFEAMCQKLSAMVKSEKSLAASAAAAVKAFQKIHNNPTKIATALQMFARDPNASLSSGRSGARCKIGLSGRRGLAAGHSGEVTKGLNHGHTQSRKRLKRSAVKRKTDTQTTGD